MGKGETEIIELDGIDLAGSGRYEDYYGYRDEDAMFIDCVANNKGHDTVRAAQDVASAELAEKLLAARI